MWRYAGPHTQTNSAYIFVFFFNVWQGVCQRKRPLSKLPRDEAPPVTEGVAPDKLKPSGSQDNSQPRVIHSTALQAYSLNKTGVPDICEVPTIIFATSYFKFVGNCVKEFAPSSIQSSRLSQPLGPWRLRGFLRGAQTLRLFLQLPTRMFLLYFRSLAPTNHQCVKIVQSIAQCSEKSDQCLVQME